MRDFIEGLPKAELHVHLEGTLGPETVLKLAARNNLDYPLKTVKNIDDALNNRTAGLQSFLDLHYLLLSVIKTGEDFHEVTYEFLRKCRENNVVYVELNFDPQLHTEKGIPFDDMIRSIDEGRKEGYKDFGVEANLIMCINRERTVESAWEMMEQAFPYRQLITGLGLDSYEQDNPPSKYTEVYEKAREQGYRVTAHCDVDQVDSTKHIWECIDLLKTDRIDHGVNSIEDPELVKDLIKRNITLTACPTWRSPYPRPRDLERIRQMYDMGLKVTLNTDDPAEFRSGYMNQTLIGAVEGSNYTKADLTSLMRNAFEGSWLPQSSKIRYIKALNDYAASRE
ncbi:adenosine deaminase [Candidatus Bathyarchaeota archaeon]|nr:adenosine deaminase [Candidatus Bathyarchaeota archaeon]